MKTWLLNASLLLTLTTHCGAQSLPASPVSTPYILKTGREVVLLGAGAAALGTAYALNRTLTPLTPAQVAQLSPANVPALDRGATSKYSVGADKLSDITLAAGVGASAVVILTSHSPGRQGASFTQSDLFTVGMMYAETMLLTNGLENTVKNAVERTRPYAYNPVAPLSEKLGKDTRRSFYSGHATNAFATAVFAAEVFRHYHPASSARPWIWVGALGLASATTYLRYEAGQHFPTDLLAGVAVGSLAGWAIPKLHENRTGTSVSHARSLTVTPWSSTHASGVYLRWSLTSQPLAVR